jgi:predicted phosphodiesterase
MPVRIAFLSDIHGNREALEACLTDLAARQVDRQVILGDIVGYGADPAFCTDTVMALAGRGAVVLRGNHDDAMGPVPHDMNADALTAIFWTRDQLTEAQRAYLAHLPLTHRDDVRLYAHASADQPARWPYITSLRGAEMSLAATDAEQVYSGHTHAPAIFSVGPDGHGDGLVPADGVPVRLASDRRWQVVVGSIGQPRDGNPDAAYSVLDLEAGTLTQHRVAYDVTGAAAKILSAGLPARLGLRLTIGQ